jgi:hypothetical protein
MDDENDLVMPHVDLAPFPMAHLGNEADRHA